MTSKLLISAVPRHYLKTITFDGSAGNGAIGTVLVGSVTGNVVIRHYSFHCLTSLAGATATIELGTAGNTDNWVATTTATALNAGEYWTGASPVAGSHGYATRWLLGSDVIITVAVAAVTAGVIEFAMLWNPLSDDGRID